MFDLSYASASVELSVGVGVILLDHRLSYSEGPAGVEVECRLLQSSQSVVESCFGEGGCSLCQVSRWGLAV